MKKAFALILCGGVIWYLWNKQSGYVSSEPAAASPSPASEVVTLLTTAPRQVPKISPTAALLLKPVARNLAPPGVYYLLHRVSITTDSGIIGVNPGTKVTLIKDSGTQLRLTDGENEFDVNATEVTNDLDVIGAMQQSDTQKQAALAAWTNAQKQAGEAQAQKQVQELDAANKAQIKAATIRDLQSRYGALTRQEANLQSQIAYEKSKRNPHAPIHDATPAPGEIENIYRQLNSVRQEERDVQKQIGELQR